MANNRVSGRQGVQTGQSGRAPAATSSSARVQPAARPSGRMQAAPAPAPAPSGRMAPQPSPSGRMVASTSGRSAAPAPASQSARARAGGSARSRGAGGDEGGGKPGKYKPRKGGPEVLIAFGIIGAIGVLALVIWMRQSGKKQEVENTVNQWKADLEANMKLGKDTFDRADQVGRLFVMGKEPNVAPDAKDLDPAVKTKIFGPFQADPNVYNVIYDWGYKDKKQKQKTRQEFLYQDRNRIERIQSPECDREDNGVRLNYGFADGKTTPIVIATKSIKPQDGDQANTGGMITVIVKAKADHIFEKAMNSKPKNEAPAAAAPEAGK